MGNTRGKVLNITFPEPLPLFPFPLFPVLLFLRSPFILFLAMLRPNQNES